MSLGGAVVEHQRKEAEINFSVCCTKFKFGKGKENQTKTEQFGKGKKRSATLT